MTGRRIGWATAGALAVAVLAVSASAPLIAYAAAPALAIACWRNVFGVAALAPAAALHRREELRRLFSSRDGLFGGLAGLALAAHFATWIPSVKLTTVAAAAALSATQPVWQGIIARAQRRRQPAATWLGIAVAVIGAVWATGADLQVSGRAVGGDGLALLGGLFAAVYTALGERVRRTVSTTGYTFVCYGVCALVLLAVCLVARQPLAGFTAATWLAIVGLTVGPQLLGHSLFNYALARVSATTISILILLEVPGAALLGWWWLGQIPRPESLPGLALLVVGVAVVVIGGAATSTRRPAEPAPL